MEKGRWLPVKSKGLCAVLSVMPMLISCSNKALPEVADLNDYFQTNSVATVPALFAPGIISTGHHEHSSAMFSPDGTQVFFTTADNSQHVIWEIDKEDKRWGQPEVAEFSGQYSDDRPFFSADGNTLYFESKRPVSDSTESTGWSIWYVEKMNGKWSDAKYDAVFTSMNIATPSIASNGNLYFCSSERAGEGSSDVYVSEFAAGAYAEPQNLGNNVNSEFMEAWLHIAPDESYLLFTSVGRPAGTGIYISVKNPDGSWSEAAFLTEINKNGDERFVTVSPDGKHLFYNSQYNRNSESSENRLTKRDLYMRLNSPQNGKGDVY